jgi:putative endonuclease
VTRSTRSIGHSWENFAARQVAAAGLSILDRRYTCRLGEIDLIAVDGKTLVFIEVRYRSHTGFGDAAASVTRHKQQRIINAARHFLMRNPDYCERPIRMDVIALEASRNAGADKPDMRWIRGAFEAQ